MAQFQPPKGSRLGDSSGLSYVLGLLAIIALLTLAALVVSVGNYYVVRLRLQRAVDAAVLAGAQELCRPIPATFAEADEIAGRLLSKVMSQELGDNLEEHLVAEFSDPAELDPPQPGVMQAQAQLKSPALLSFGIALPGSRQLLSASAASGCSAPQSYAVEVLVDASACCRVPEPQGGSGALLDNRLVFSRELVSSIYANLRDEDRLGVVVYPNVYSPEFEAFVFRGLTLVGPAASRDLGQFNAELSHWVKPTHQTSGFLLRDLHHALMLARESFALAAAPPDRLGSLPPEPVTPPMPTGTIRSVLVLTYGAPILHHAKEDMPEASVFNLTGVSTEIDLASCGLDNFGGEYDLTRINATQQLLVPAFLLGSSAGLTLNHLVLSSVFSILRADELRREGVTVNVLGIGSGSSPLGASGTEPYGEISRYEPPQRILRRLANTPEPDEDALTRYFNCNIAPYKIYNKPKLKPGGSFALLSDERITELLAKLASGGADRAAAQEEIRKLAAAALNGLPLGRATAVRLLR